MAVVVMGTLRFPPEHMERVKPHLRRLLDATRGHDGCIAYDVAEDALQPGLLRFSELWPDFETLERHLSAPHIAPWRTACAELGARDRRFTAWQVGEARPL
jgi:quinol monooxygenase YgiN